MQILTSYNSIAAGFDIPLAESVLNPAAVYGIFDDFRLLTEWDARTSVASGNAPALTSNSIYGEVACTPAATNLGGHATMKTMSFLPAAGKPVYTLWRAKMNAAGQYFLGITNTSTAANTLVVTSNALTAGRGAGILVQTTNAIDVISRDGTTDVRNQNVATLVADTYALFGIALYTNVAEFYINGKRISSTPLTLGVGTTGYTPTFEANTAAKALTVDFVACAQER